MSAADKILSVVERPMHAVQGIIALAMCTYGLFLASPYYVSTSGDEATGELSLIRVGFAVVFFVLPALPTILSFFMFRFRAKVWRKRSCFYMFCGLTILVILRILSAGFFPFIWLFPLATGLISAILYLHWQATL